LKKKVTIVQAHNHIMGLNQSINEIKDYMEEIPDYREMKRDVLANRHQFGEAAAHLKNALNHSNLNLSNILRLKKKVTIVQAHNHIMGLNQSINEIKDYMEEIP
ncbi:septation ring formation regulator EzrA, partial [Staphylococcus aureus]|uniref:septation ring formation regulator EzrA n=1 Tax=Staphylococcus aureus TaxID=1280 RepID=UPI000F41D48F